MIPIRHIIDAARVAAELDGFADVGVIRSGSATFALADALGGKKYSVFGNAGRVYPAGTEWLEDEYMSPLILVRDVGAVRAAERLIGDARSMGPARTVIETATPAGPTTSTAVFTGASGDGDFALVRTAGGLPAALYAEDVIPGVRLDWVLGIGHELTGTIDRDSRRFRPDMELTQPRILTEYHHGQVVLAQVVSASKDSAVLRLWPGMDRTIGRDAVSSNPRDSVDELLAPGEVVAARLSTAGGRATLSVLDVDDDEAIAPAPALVVGGIAWLDLARSAVVPVNRSDDSETAPLDTGAEALGAGGLRETLERAQRERDDALIRADRLADDNAHLRRELRSARETLRRKVREVGKAVQPSPRTQFARDDEAFHHELYLAWVDSVPPEDKGAVTLPARGEYHVGSGFLASLEHPHVAPRRAKVLGAVVRALVDDRRYAASLDLHRVRTGEGGNDPAVVREDGAVLWRAAVQRNTSAALRLHFWRLPDGRIELDTVQPHDEGI